ncbi:MAG TPA: diacylglycerol kinase family protein [Planctomycetota bacterium]|nr:diacylglycerol kinase family protein [Planctomycetota bacterium]
MLRRVLLVTNPISGRGRNRVAAPRLAAELERLRVGVEIAWSQRPGHAVDLASFGPGAGFDAVVAVGGDGTLREVVEGVAGRLPVGVLPTGTANVMARELELPFRAAAAAAVIAEGKSARVDTARAAGRPVLFAVGVGFDASVVRELARRRNGPISFVSYLAPGVRALARWRPAPLRITVDGDPIPPCPFAVVCGTRHYGGPWVRFAPGIALDDGCFELYRFATPSIPSLLRATLRGILGGLPGGAVTRQPARRVRIEADEAVPVQIDGDPAGDTPIDVEVAPRSLPILVPPSSPLLKTSR